MGRNKKLNIVFSFLFIILLFLPFQFKQFQQYLSIPKEMTIFHTDHPIPLPKIKHLSIANHPFIKNGTFYPTTTGNTEIVYEAGNIPLKKVAVTVLDEPKIIPGGQSIGVQMHTLGVLVVGYHTIDQSTKDKSIKSPAELANIQIGDIILEINGEKVKKINQLKDLVQRAGENNEPLDIVIKRGQEKIQTTMDPIFNKNEDIFQIGLYIRDSTTGIGTVSFIEKDTGNYGALGHIISDMNTKKPIDLHEGKIMRSTITNILKGNQGIPGEKQAEFITSEGHLGTIDKNSPFGIFGKMNIEKLKTKEKPLPIALAKDVEKGPAHILTVVEGEKVEKFTVDIVNSIPQTYPSTKGMIIKVTDERLLDKTGGIVQGMSGSPIIQNDKLIGAITHVFVNDPTSGYGIHIEWMLQEANVNIFEQEKDFLAMAL